MEKLKVGNKEYEMITSISEIRYDKMTLFNQYIIAIFQGLDMPLFQVTMDKVRNHYDKGEYMQGYHELVNFDTAIKFKEHNIDALGMAFILLLKSDETDERALMIVLNEMIDNGLKWETVKKKVLSFMNLLPERFSPYLQAWKMMETGIDL